MIILTLTDSNDVSTRILLGCGNFVPHIMKWAIDNGYTANETVVDHGIERTIEETARAIELMHQVFTIE